MSSQRLVKRRAHITATSGSVLLLLLLLLLQVTLPARAAVAYLVTTNKAVVPTAGIDRSQLTAACTAARADATPATFGAGESPAALLYPAMNAAQATQVYVAAMYTTVDIGALWLWDSTSFIVTSQMWATGYPAGDELTLKYAVYDSAKGGLVNVDGNTPLAVGCMYGSPDDVAPPMDAPETKKGFPWWAILIIVLGAVVIVVVVIVVVCCCCCRKKKSYDDADVDAEELDEDEQRLEQRQQAQQQQHRSRGMRDGSDSESDTASDSRSFSGDSSSSSSRAAGKPTAAAEAEGERDGDGEKKRHRHRHHHRHRHSRHNSSDEE